ncbi:MAG: GntR family transcriptional regulator [Williamsia herbipolensis]|nr:GntR family transcriptional regulator [Williamsia herbipolensis]
MADLHERPVDAGTATGDRLPGLESLHRRYGDAALATIREALTLLAEANLLRIERGSNAVVIVSDDDEDLVDPFAELRLANVALREALDNLDSVLQATARTRRDALLAAADDLEAVGGRMDVRAVPAWLRARAASRV